MSKLANSRKWSPDSGAPADRAGAGLPRRQGAGRGRGAACELSAAGFCRRGTQPQTRFGAGCRRPGIPPPGRRLRRELRRARRQQHPRFLPPVPADGGGADLCGGLAGGEGRPHRRPVRQAALFADRKARRHGAAGLSRRHHQRHRLHAGGAHSRSAPAARGLPAIGGDAQSVCAPSPPAAMPTCRTRINGCCRSSTTVRNRSATRNSPII